MSARILVVALGNALMGDDGFGPAVAVALERAGLPRDVRIERGETDASRLPGIWRGEPHVWLIDAVARGATPGTVHHIGHDRLLALDQIHAGAHRLSLPESLRWIRHAYPEMAGVRYRLWGVEPGAIRETDALSDAVAAAIPDVVARIREAFANARAGPLE